MSKEPLYEIEEKTPCPHGIYPASDCAICLEEKKQKKQEEEEE